MTDETPVTKVISLRTRGEYVPPKRQGRYRGKIDRLSVETLEECLQGVRDGKFVGVCIIAFDAKTKMPLAWTEFDPKETSPEVAAVRSIGAVELLKQALIDVVEFGLNGLNEGLEMEIVDPEDLPS